MDDDPMIEQIRNERRWLEKSLGITQYHNSQQSKFEKTRGKKWTVQDTAQETKLSVGYISESLKLAKAHLRGIVFDGMTRENALKMIRNNND